MKVILLKDVKALGKAGEVKEVKDGYGNNFLIGRGLAQLASKENIRKLDAKNQKLKEEEENLLNEYKKIKENIEKNTFTMIHKLSKNGSLYGAITKNEIASFLEDKNILIDKKSMDIKSPIKTSGIHSIDINLGHGIHAILNLDIVGQ
jgi:large subunit ribosomal protein L9